MSRLVPDSLYGAEDDIFQNTMYTSEFWAPRDEKDSKLFVALDGLNSGVPTRTTATLTPTMLRNIEQTFLELTSETAASEPHTAQAGFVPPVVTTHSQVTSGGSVYLNTESKAGWGGGSATVGRPPANPSPAASSTPSPPLPTQQMPRRNMGGRRPAKVDKLSPEEEERRKVRRERNKLAAARCRKRRLDHTNELLKETEGLEQKKQCLQSEIQQLQREKEDLEFILEAHKPCCRLLAPPGSPPDVKPSRTQLQQQSRPLPKLLPVQQTQNNNNAGKQPAQRPSSLPVAAFTPALNKLEGTLSEVAGVPITTPSAGIPFNFDSLMEGGTGLTPVSALAPSCSSQQRNCEGIVVTSATNVDLSSPDGSGHSSLKLVSL